MLINNVDCFVPYKDEASARFTVEQLSHYSRVSSIYLLTTQENVEPIENCSVLRVPSFDSTAMLKIIGEVVTAKFWLFVTSPVAILLSYRGIGRMVSIASSVGAHLLYTDRLVEGDDGVIQHPCIDYVLGSVRDDFDFGSLMLFSRSSLLQYLVENAKSDYKYSALYDYRLFISRMSTPAQSIVHMNEYLYSEMENVAAGKAVSQFDYVDPSNRAVQIEREEVCTKHLQAIGAYINSENLSEVATMRHQFDIEASVIIPVKNRVKTIEDAIRSALSQQTTFKFNVLVVDNYSTDGTSEVIERLAAEDDRLVCIRPAHQRLGIGGCWSLAVDDTRCGQYAVQLDSDDLYSSEHVLQRIVDTFRKDHCAMVVGSYRICDFALNTLPPGLITHSEWTEQNGLNNALRINGFGAPRAFYTPLLRRYPMPNTSYGEDYATCLRFSRRFKISRIYDELYLCRRWDGNSDAALTPLQLNQNNRYKDSIRTHEIMARQKLNTFWNREVNPLEVRTMFREQLQIWSEAAENYKQLENVLQSEFVVEDVPLTVQFNPARIGSTGAKIDARSLAERPCFLCEENRSLDQLEYPVNGKYILLVNPYPILPEHYTIPCCRHVPQRIYDTYIDMMRMTEGLKHLFVFYNGPSCGASAPDHLHFQAGLKGYVPLERDFDRLYRAKRSRLYPITDSDFIESLKLEEAADDMGIYSLRGYVVPGFIIISRTPQTNEILFKKLYAALPKPEGEPEPMMNVLSWMLDHTTDGRQRIVSLILPRTKHRPDCYSAEGDANLMVSPGALDMAGMVITPRAEDFGKMNAQKLVEILREVAISPAEEIKIIMRLKNLES